MNNNFIIQRGLIKIDNLTEQAFADGVNLSLRQKEFAVLLFLIQNEGQLMSPELIYENVWSQPMNDDKTALKVAVSRLRKKIKFTGYNIESVYGRGYIFKCTLKNCMTKV